MIIDNIEVDSFKIRIPFELCEIIDVSIIGNWILVNEMTGIIDEADFKKNSISLSFFVMQLLHYKAYYTII